MREIKFRGKRIDTGEWAYGSLIVCNNDALAIMNNVSRKADSYHFVILDVDPETVGQYVGKKDKNGKEIYEDDLLSSRNDNPEHDIWDYADMGYGVVKYCPDSASFDFEGFMLDDEESVFSAEFTEVVGNIHDNSKINF